MRNGHVLLRRYDDRGGTGCRSCGSEFTRVEARAGERDEYFARLERARIGSCLLYTSDAADERSCVDFGGRRIIKKKNDGRRTDEAQTKQTA